MEIIRSPYLTVRASIHIEIEPIKRSRFIGHILPMTSKNILQQHLEEVKRLTPGANHYCWAYQLYTDKLVQFNDDGEPSGSAGRPILTYLAGQQIFDTLIVVARFFGGTKLGTGGLVRAYGSAASEVIALAQLQTITPTRALWVKHSYALTASIQSLLHELSLTPTHPSYKEQVIFCLNIPDENWEEIKIKIVNAGQGNLQISKEKIK